MGQQPLAPDFGSVASMLFEIGKEVVRMKNLPQQERQRYRDVIHETYILLQSGVLLVMNKLGSLKNLADEYHLNLQWANHYPERSEFHRDKARDVSMQFVLELGKLGSAQEWKEIEQTVSVCRPLADVAAEMESLRSRLRASFSFKDPANVKEQIYYILKGERPFAQFISSTLKELASLMSEASQSEAGLEKAMKKVSEVRDHFDRINHSLMEQHLDFQKSFVPRSTR